VVAETILYCCEHPERDVFIGGGGKAISTSGYMAPRLTDRLMERTLFDRQQKDAPPNGRDSLFAPSEDLAERGDYDGHTMESSLYTTVSLHPWITGALMIGLGVVAMAVLTAGTGED
jgi:hypothetical protein